MSSLIERAASTIRSGGLVIFPTETVYGLGANAFDPKAVARIFEVKQRPLHNPLIVHIESLDWLSDLAANFPPAANILAKSFWPGPLTLVLPKKSTIPEIVSAGLPTVGLRVPSHPMAQELLHQTQVPIAAPSANAFGRLSPTQRGHLDPVLTAKTDCILDGGVCEVGVESTIIGFDDSGTPELLRLGGLALETIETKVGTLVRQTHATPQAPGMLSHHYAPRTPLVLDNEKRPQGQLGCIAFDRVENADTFAAVELLSPTGNLREAAANLYCALHRLDGMKLDAIVALPFPDRDLGAAINDRLRRASARF